MNIVDTKQKNCQELERIPGLQVRLIPDLSAAAFRQKLTKELSLWYCLRAINQPFGDGVLPLDIAIESLINDFGYSRTGAYRRLYQANNKVLEITDNKRRAVIKIYGLNRLCEGLTIKRLYDRHFRQVPAGRFNTLIKRRSEIYASIHHPERIKSNPISRQTISEMTGLHRIQQRRYEKVASVKRTANFAFHTVDNPLGPQYVPMKQEIFTRKGGLRDINKRLGNTYHSRQEPSNKGMLQKTSANLRGSKSLISVEAPNLVRLFFWTSKKLVKALLKRTRIDKEGFHLISSRKRIKRGRMEWGYVTV